MKPTRLLSVVGAVAMLAAGAVLFQNRVAAAATDTGATGLTAPAWQLKDLDGKDVASDQFKGKVVVLDFWATWCGPCVEEIPNYIALQKKYGADGLVIVGVSVDRKKVQDVKKFVEAKGINYPIVMADETIVEAFGGFDAIPTTFLINREGRIVNRKTGMATAADYEKLVKKALE